MKFWFETPLGKARIDEINAQPPAVSPKTSQPRRRMSTRMYAAAKSSRLTSDWNWSNSSADSELVSSLQAMRSRSRQLVRDASYAKRAKSLVVNNVIGWDGIGMQAQVKTNAGKLVKRINDDIEGAWDEWCQADSCHTGGRLHFAHFERACMAQVFEAGEVFIRIHLRKFGNSNVPLALELIEAERIADDFSQPGPVSPGAHIRMGVEMDSFHRPLAYWIRKSHPGEVRWTYQASQEFERVPADQIIHLAATDRWPQTRGEPWMHAAARRLNDMDGYSEAEIIRARSQASMSGAIMTSEDADDFGEEQLDGSYEMETEPGVFKRLNPGEEMQFPSPSSPNPAMDPFMRYMLREVAAGLGVSYESISGDYSQSNYSSSRMGLLDSRDVWRFIQWWFIRDFRARIHKLWLQQAVLAGAITTFTVEDYALNLRKYQAVRFKPRGWTWVDPTKEVAAYGDAIEKGMTTLSDVIAQTAGGDDIEDVATRRASELELLKEKGLVFTTSPEFYDKPEPAPAPAAGAPAKDPDDDAEDPDQATEDPPARRVFPFKR